MTIEKWADLPAGKQKEFISLTKLAIESGVIHKDIDDIKFFYVDYDSARRH